MAAAVFEKIKLLMDGSFFFRFVEGLMSFIARLFSGSILVRFIIRDTDGGLKDSAFYKIFIYIFSIPERLRNKFFSRMWEVSAAVRFSRGILTAFISLTLRDIGFGLLSGTLAFVYFAGRADLFCICLFIACVISLFFKQRAYILLSESGFMRFICYLFDFSLPKIKFKRPIFIFPVLYGILGGVLFARFPFIYAAALFIALPGALIIITYPFIGVLGVIFLAPFIPTMTTAALIGGVYVLFTLKLLTDRRYNIKLDLTGFFILIFIIINLFKGFTSLTPSTSINIALLTSLFMSVYFLVISTVNSRKKLEQIIFAFVTSAFLTGLYGFMQLLSGQRDMRWVDKKLFEELGMRVFSTFQNPNVYGEYLLLAIPVTLSALILVRRPLMKLYYAGVSVVLFINLGFTYSRGCYLAIAFAVFVFVLLMEKRLVAFLSAGVFIIPAVLPMSMLNRLLSITNLEDSSSIYRLSIYRASIRILQRFWVSGVGQGYEAFNRVFPLYAFNGVTASHAHNLFLQVFIETGVFGIIAFLCIFVCFFKSLAPLIYKTKDIKIKCMAGALIAMMAGFILQSLFEHSFYNYKVYMLFFAAAAFAGVLREGRKEI